MRFHDALVSVVLTLGAERVMRTRSRRWAGSAIGQSLQFATGCIAPPSGHANLTQLDQAVDGAAQTRGRSWTPGAPAWARPMDAVVFPQLATL